MALADWYELVDHQDFGDAGVVLNVYHLQRSGALISAQEINQAFVDWVLPSLRTFQVTNLSHVKLVTRNLGDANDFQETTVGLAGTSAGAEGAATFAAYRIQFLRERTDMKHGWKRFPGVPEANVNFSTVVPAVVTTLQTLGDKLVSPWEVASNPGVSVARLGIIARVCAEFDALGACVSYRLPESDAELDFYIPDQALARNTLASQTSRK